MRRLFTAVLLAAFMLPVDAHATFPGANGKIAFVRDGDIWTMNPNGSGQANLTNTPAHSPPYQSEAHPAWSPDGTKIAFDHPLNGISGPLQIYVMNADGSNVIPTGNGVTNDFSPTWSPDGTKIAYQIQASIGLMNSDGTDHQEILDPNGVPRDVDWSPDGRALAFGFTCSPNDFDFYGGVIGKLEPVAPGGSSSQLTDTCLENQQSIPNFDLAPSWRPDAQRILFVRRPTESATPVDVYTVKPDGSDVQLLKGGYPNTVAPVWSPDATKIALSVNGRIRVMNADGTGETDITDGTDPQWQPVPINAYPRPKGASPFRVSLVPANAQCTSPNVTHGAPLAFGSCKPPALTSQYLTTGTPDSNGRAAHMVAYMQLNAIVGNSSTPADEADLSITADINDVAKKDLSDYTGGLRAVLPLRITDKNNTPSPGGPGAATTEPFQYGFEIPCTPDPDPSIGSDCAITTTADTLVPGTIKESLRTVWQIGRARVDDSGADSNPSTTGDNTVFAVQGVFIP